LSWERNRIRLRDAGASVTMALDERWRWGWNKIRLPDAGMFKT